MQFRERRGAAGARKLVVRKDKKVDGREISCKTGKPTRKGNATGKGTEEEHKEG